MVPLAPQNLDSSMAKSHKPWCPMEPLYGTSCGSPQVQSTGPLLVQNPRAHWDGWDVGVELQNCADTPEMSAERLRACSRACHSETKSSLTKALLFHFMTAAGVESSQCLQSPRLSYEKVMNSRARQKSLWSRKPRASLHARPCSGPLVLATQSELFWLPSPALRWRLLALEVAVVRWID